MRFGFIVVMSVVLWGCGKSGSQSSALNIPSEALPYPVDMAFSSQADKDATLKTTPILTESICPKFVTLSDNIEKLQVRVGEANQEAQRSKKWARSVGYEFALKSSPKLGRASGHHCFIEVGEGGAYIKNACVRDFCGRSESPDQQLLMTYISEPRLKQLFSH